MNLEAAKTALLRRAFVLDIGGRRPPGDPFACWFRRVNFAAKGEQWPTTTGKASMYFTKSILRKCHSDRHV